MIFNPNISQSSYIDKYHTQAVSSTHNFIMRMDKQSKDIFLLPKDQSLGSLDDFIQKITLTSKDTPEMKKQKLESINELFFMIGKYASEGRKVTLSSDPIFYAHLQERKLPSRING